MHGRSTKRPPNSGFGSTTWSQQMILRMDSRHSSTRNIHHDTTRNQNSPVPVQSSAVAAGSCVLCLVRWQKTTGQAPQTMSFPASQAQYLTRSEGLDDVRCTGTHVYECHCCPRLNKLRNAVLGRYPAREFKSASQNSDFQKGPTDYKQNYKKASSLYSTQIKRSTQVGILNVRGCRRNSSVIGCN